jgi:hypothetical protein
MLLKCQWLCLSLTFLWSNTQNWKDCDSYTLKGIENCWQRKYVYIITHINWFREILKFTDGPIVRICQHRTRKWNTDMSGAPLSLSGHIKSYPLVCFYVWNNPSKLKGYSCCADINHHIPLYVKIPRQHLHVFLEASPHFTAYEDINESKMCAHKVRKCSQRLKNSGACAFLSPEITKSSVFSRKQEVTKLVEQDLSTT